MKVSLWSEPPPVLQRVSAPLEEYTWGEYHMQVHMHWLMLYSTYSIPLSSPYLQPAAVMHAQLVNMALGVDHDTNHIQS